MTVGRDGSTKKQPGTAEPLLMLLTSFLTVPIHGHWMVAKNIKMFLLSNIPGVSFLVFFAVSLLLGDNAPIWLPATSSAIGVIAIAWTLFSGVIIAPFVVFGYSNRKTREREHRASQISEQARG